MMKNDCLNVWKGIGAFFVVFIHCSFPSPVGGMMNGLARFAVPLFFMVSGYFAYGRPETVIRRRMGKTFRVFLGANLVYFFWSLFLLYQDGELAGRAVAEFFSPASFWRFILWNQSPFMYHLWFLGALLYCYLFYSLLLRFQLEERVYILIPLCLAANLILGEGLGILGSKVPVFYMRNFWVTGLPFFLWGHWFAGKQKKLSTRPGFLVCAAAAGACLSMGEMLASGGAELYLGTIVAVGSLFLFALQKPALGRGSLLAHIGEKDSQHIYLWQVIVYYIISFLAEKTGMSGHALYSWLVPLAVCMASWLLAELLVKIGDFRKENTV